MGDSWSCVCSVLVPAWDLGPGCMKHKLLICCSGRASKARRHEGKAPALNGLWSWSHAAVAARCRLALISLIQQVCPDGHRWDTARLYRTCRDCCVAPICSASPWQVYDSPCCPPVLQQPLQPSCARCCAVPSGLTGTLLLHGTAGADPAPCYRCYSCSDCLSHHLSLSFSPHCSQGRLCHSKLGKVVNFVRPTDRECGKNRRAVGCTSPCSEHCGVAQQSKRPACCVASLDDGGASSSGSACARDTVLGCSNEAGLCLGAPFSLKPRTRMGQLCQEPLANVFDLGTPWEQGCVLQRGGKGPSVDGDVVPLGGAEPACGGQEVRTGYGTLQSACRPPCCKGLPWAGGWRVQRRAGGKPALDCGWLCNVVSLGPAMGVTDRRGSTPGESGSLLL